jgi:hypothetical protein
MREGVSTEHSLGESCTQLLYPYSLREQGIQLTDYIQRRNFASGVLRSAVAILHR